MIKNINKAIGELINKYQHSENELLKDYRTAKCDFIRHIISYRLSLYVDIVDDLKDITSQENEPKSDALSSIIDRRELLLTFSQWDMNRDIDHSDAEELVDKFLKGEQ